MNGWFILLVAISISAVAAYYSIVGLAAIFAGAVIPVIIMASVLEIGKLVSAVWLHQNWNSIHFLMKTYFTSAVIILMFITSMGIFGFLSRAHIEHSGSSVQLVADVENIEQELFRYQTNIERKTDQIAQLGNRDFANFSQIQSQIDQEQANIDRIYARVQPDIDRLETALQSASTRKESIQDFFIALETNDIRKIQSIVGVSVDGNLGPQTRAAIEDFRTRATSELSLLDQTILDNTSRIAELRASVLPLVEESNSLINQLRSRISFSDNDELQIQIDALSLEISELETEYRNLTTEKFELETKLRLYEVEIGPIKYIAEFAYGNSESDIIEKAVRWVIFLIIFVFDPLAVLLVLAAVSTIHKKQKVEAANKNLDKLKEEINKISDEYFSGVTFDDDLNPAVETKEIPVEATVETNPVELTYTGRNIKKFKDKLFKG